MENAGSRGGERERERVADCSKSSSDQDASDQDASDDDGDIYIDIDIDISRLCLSLCPIVSVRKLHTNTLCVYAVYVHPILECSSTREALECSCK